MRTRWDDSNLAVFKVCRMISPHGLAKLQLVLSYMHKQCWCWTNFTWADEFVSACIAEMTLSVFHSSHKSTVYNCQMTMLKSAQILPPRCEREVVWCGGFVLFLSLQFHSLNCRNVSPYIGLLKYKMIPTSHVGLDIPSQLLRILLSLKRLHARRHNMQY